MMSYNRTGHEAESELHTAAQNEEQRTRHVSVSSCLGDDVSN